MTKVQMAGNIERLENIITWMIEGLTWIASGEAEDGKRRDVAELILKTLPTYADGIMSGTGGVVLDAKAWERPKLAIRTADVEQGRFPWMMVGQA